MTAGGATEQDRLVIDSWIDVLCAWCFLNSRRLDAAVARSPRADGIRITVHTFALHPAAPRVATATMEYLARQFGTTPERMVALERPVAEQLALAGLPYTPDRPMAKTDRVARLVDLAVAYGAGPAYVRAVQQEIFSGNPDTFDPATLVSLGTALGLPAAELLEVLHSDRFSEAVRADQVRAVTLGATGVPFTLMADRFVFSGAATTAQYDDAIEHAWQYLDVRQRGGDTIRRRPS